jgi:hypothetical protein
MMMLIRPMIPMPVQRASSGVAVSGVTHRSCPEGYVD